MSDFHTGSIPRPSLLLLAGIFFRIGLTAFGGPIAAISIMEEEIVRKRKWLIPEVFSEIFAVCKLLPGPIAPQVAISIGKLLSGFWGGVLSGVAFVIPAIFLVTIVAALYSKGEWFAGQERLFQGMQLGAIAVIVSSIISLFKPYYKKGMAWTLLGICGGLTFLSPRFEPLYILGSGFLGVAWTQWQGRSNQKKNHIRLLPLGLSMGFSFKPQTVFAAVIGAAGVTAIYGTLFWSCFKAAAFVFGTGIAVVPVMENDFVKNLGWITHSQFMDAVAIGQITPGPFVITATFIGYQVAGLSGAMIASLGIFLPSFINVLGWLPWVWDRFSKSPSSKVFVAFAMPAVVGAIIAATLSLTYSSVSSLRQILILVMCGIAAIAWKWPSWLLIPGAGAVFWGLGLL